MKVFDKPLFIFEMANNHMGDLDHGIKIVKEFKKITSGISEFNFSVKLQYRDDSFFHPAHKDRQDHRLIKRFMETRLFDGFKTLTEAIRDEGFITMCTPWDEQAVTYLEDLNYDILKIASCSFNDWPLWERMAKSNKPIIASTAGAKLDSIDQVVSFLNHRSKDFAIMHCVGEYPCPNENLELNQIDFFRERYPNIPIGFSTHEDPETMDSIKVSVAKGASLFEKHVGVATDKYALNAYSADPEQAKRWIESAMEAYTMCGGPRTKRKGFSQKELDDLGILYRGAYVKADVKKGEKISNDNIFLAMPNIEGQLVANQMSKYNEFLAESDIKANEPIMLKDIKIKETRKKVNEIVDKLKKILSDSKVALPHYVDVEISYHYGIDRFDEIGGILVQVLNREYSKILLVMFPGQSYPKHHHVQKDESYHILYGDLTVDIEGVEHHLQKGSILSVNRGQVHSFKTKGGVIIEEIATTYIKGDSYYSDDSISKNPNRKTYLTCWPEWMD
ncbi:MAG: N-acetylneuraminate synthase family protein [Chitinophagales bacterium]|nr:N-acetylneuraminate synthase family protein [Chitinophagales bacterium]